MIHVVVCSMRTTVVETLQSGLNCMDITTKTGQAQLLEEYRRITVWNASKIFIKFLQSQIRFQNKWRWDFIIVINDKYRDVMAILPTLRIHFLRLTFCEFADPIVKPFWLLFHCESVWLEIMSYSTCHGALGGGSINVCRTVTHFVATVGDVPPLERLGDVRNEATERGGESVGRRGMS